ncbi:unnamed protein product [Linum trigynum]|uniref:Uncharacterized protein n=1 Tax=Linum trigynum TaxID=586398 RepID=A0AAV2CHN1_9ROSI
MKPMTTDAILEKLKTEDRIPYVSSIGDRLSFFGFPCVVLGGRQTVCLARGVSRYFSFSIPSEFGRNRSLARRMVAMSW